MWLPWEAILQHMNDYNKINKKVTIASHFVVDKNIRWTPPFTGWVKLNIDGVVKRFQKFGCGGLLRGGDTFVAFQNLLEFVVFT